MNQIRSKTVPNTEPSPTLRNTALLVSGNSLSYLGDLLYLMVMNMWIARATGRPELLGTMTAVSSFALFAMNPIGGVLADRFSKKTLLVLTDLVSALAVLIVYFSYSSNSVPILPVVIANVVLSLAFAIYSPTARSIAPLLARDSDLRKLNSLLSASNDAIRVAAPAIGGLLLAWHLAGERSLILANALSFFISAVSGSCLAPRAQPRFLGGETRVFSGYKEAWDHLGENKTSFVSILIINFFSGGLVVLLPFLPNKTQQTTYPMLLVAQAAGAILGGFLASRLKKNLPVLQSQMLLLASGVSLMFLSPAINSYFQYSALFFFGMFIAVFNVNIFTLIQTQTREHLLGRTFGLLFTAAAGLLPVGNLFFGKLEALRPGYGSPLLGLGIVGSILAAILARKPKAEKKPLL